VKTLEDWVREALGQAPRRGPDPRVQGMSPEEIAEAHRRVGEAFGIHGEMFSDWFNQKDPTQPSNARPYPTGDNRRFGPISDPRVRATMRLEFARQRLREMGGMDDQ